MTDKFPFFEVGGHDTTSNMISWTLYLLAKHSDVQSRCVGEIKKVMQKGVSISSELERLVCMRKVIDESIRLYPPVPVFFRQALKDDEIDGIRIPSDAAVEISPFITHRHPGFWEDPEKFDPSRFDSHVVEKRHPFAYFPFGAGARECIGKHFAITETLIILVCILKKFRLELAVQEDITPQAAITLRLRGGVALKLFPQSNLS